MRVEPTRDTGHHRREDGRCASAHEEPKINWNANVMWSSRQSEARGKHDRTGQDDRARTELIGEACPRRCC